MTHRSFRNRVWNTPQLGDRAITAISDAGAPAAVARILAAREMNPTEVSFYLAPTLRDAMPNPSFFLDMDLAADRLVTAITSGQKIMIWSDYDVDGATSAATLGRFLRDCGRSDVEIYIPDRIAEGYGPNTEGLLALQAAGAEIVCILDSGTTAFEPLAAARAAGLDVIVVDHHAAEEELPEAIAVVNPNRLDQAEGYGHVCAAGMTFMLTVAVNLRLRRMGWFDGADGRPATAPDLMSYLDLVALGTVCDVVPLTGINRAFVARGLPVLSARRLPGIRALAEVAGCADEIDTAACGFALGPRINAGGRIGTSGAGAALLLETDDTAAAEQAEALNTLNTQRQALEKSCTADALAQFGSEFVPGETRRIALAVVDAHEGIVGISAARLKEALDAPAFVLASTPEGHLKGSGRSVSGFDLGAAIIAARKAGILVKGGGHAMAGGITIEPDRLEEFRAFVDARIAESDYARTGIVSRVDAGIAIHEAHPGAVDAIQTMAPFGMGNPTPRIMLGGVYLSEVKILKEKHLKCVLQHPVEKDRGPQIEAVIWNSVETPFGAALVAAQGTLVDALGAMEINEWRDRRRVQMKLDDMRLAS